jgi:hypothetical protein
MPLTRLTRLTKNRKRSPGTRVPIVIVDALGNVLTGADGVVLTYGTAKIKPTGDS